MASVIVHSHLISSWSVWTRLLLPSRQRRRRAQTAARYFFCVLPSLVLGSAGILTKTLLVASFHFAAFVARGILVGCCMHRCRWLGAHVLVRIQTLKGSLTNALIVLLRSSGVLSVFGIASAHSCVVSY